MRFAAVDASVLGAFFAADEPRRAAVAQRLSVAALAVKAEVDRAPSSPERWSDHALVVVDHDLRNR